jgi:hypothetical protein
MSYLSIIKSPQKFRESFLSCEPNSQIDTEFGAVIRVLLFFVWRGSFNAGTSILQAKVQPDLGFLCLSTYKIFLPIIQLIRLGYVGDSGILLRTSMEQIAIIGYLNKNRDLIQKYRDGKSNFQKDAMKWAKSHAPKNWMHLHSYLSNIAHSRPEGVASHIFERNEIGEAFRYILPSSKKPSDITEVFLGLTFYALIALDPIASEILECEDLKEVMKNCNSIKGMNQSDWQEFYNFLQILVVKYGYAQTF